MIWKNYLPLLVCYPTFGFDLNIEGSIASEHFTSDDIMLHVDCDYYFSIF